MKGKGWHPVTIVCHGGKETKFDITWDSRKNVEWFLYYDMSPDGFAKRKEELGKKGFKVTSETNYKVGGEERISAIWEKK